MKGTPYGRYELVRKIAAGGMAEIFLARSWGEGGFFREVVIKRLFSNLAEHPSALRMFQTEAQLLAHLSHPNIPQVMDLGFVDGAWYIAMEYVEGWTIADVWRASARKGAMMPLPVTLGAMMQVCEALQHAHRAKDRAGRDLAIVHRDVTPQNIMVTRGGVVKLMDFGVAKTDARAQTEAGAVKGTFSYMAPEQVRGQSIDARADVFSLGVILYELTTGTRLFRGNDMQVMVQVVEQDAPPPSERVPDYPADLEEIVMAAVRRDRRGRIASAADFVLHLEHFAMRHGLLVGPRTLAEFVQTTIPATPVQDEEYAIVPATLEASPELQFEVEGADSAVSEVDARDVEDDDEQDSAADLESGALALEEHQSSRRPPSAAEDTGGFQRVTLTEAEPPARPALSRLDTVPPAPLEGFDDDLMSSADRPVVLLDTKKAAEATPPSEDGYLEEIRKRLEDV